MTNTQIDIKIEGTVLYIFDPTNYKGSIENCLTRWEDGTETIHYMDKGMTFDQYKAIKGNENLIALEWEEFNDKYRKPHLDNIVHNWAEISEERFYDMFECLPPIMISGRPLAFFMGECYTENIYTFCAEHKGKFYSSPMYRNTPPNDLKQSLVDWLEGKAEVSKTQE